MRWSLFLCWLMIALGAAAQPSRTDRQVLVITADEGAPYAEALGGIAAGLPNPIQPRVLHLDRDKAEIAKIGPAALAIALGSRAAQALAKWPGDLVACMVFRSRDDAGTARRYAVVLDHPMDLQLQWIRRFLPQARRLLVIYTPEENSQRVELARLAAARAGLTLVLRPASDPAFLPGILDQSTDVADAIWGLPDSQLMNRHTARQLLLFSYRNQMPMIAPADNWVEAGALLAFGWNLNDLGRQCGETAASLLEGRKPAAPVITPRTLNYSLNRRALTHFRVKPAEALIGGASRIHD